MDEILNLLVYNRIDPFLALCPFSKFQTPPWNPLISHTSPDYAFSAIKSLPINIEPKNTKISPLEPIPPPNFIPFPKLFLIK